MHTLLKNRRLLVCLFFPCFMQAGVMAEMPGRSLKTIKEVISVPMRDGTLLSTNIFMSDNRNEKLPLILVRTDSNKEAMDMLGYFFAFKGYAVAIQDVRGRFASGGEWEPFVNEAQDGYDAIEWLATREWCNGMVGMTGGSYQATCQVLAALLDPPHLKAIIPYCLPSDPFLNAPYENGIFLLAPEAWWTYLIESESVTFLDQGVIAKSHAVKDSPFLNDLPVTDADMKITGKNVPYWRKWLTHNSNDSYWESISFLDSLPNIKIPILLQSGWYDTHNIGTTMAWEALSKSKTPAIKLIIGPWNHSNVVPRYPSTRNTGKEAAIDLMNTYLRWFDRWLRGTDNGIENEPRVSVYIMNDRRWVYSDDYPLQNTSFSQLYFTSTQGANSLKGDGRLTWSPPSAGRHSDTYIYNPADPTPAFIYRNYRGKELSDSLTSQRNDILVFETEPLDTAVTIAGPITARLFASSSCPDTDWFITLYAADEKGNYMPLSHGCLRARFRDSTKEARLLKPGKTYEYTIDLWHTAIKLDKGWKLKAEIASADFPQYSRNLNTGGNNETETEFRVAEQKVFYQSKKASCLILPILNN